MKPISHHQPLFPVSCSRLTNTAKLGINNIAPTIYEMTGKPEPINSCGLLRPAGIPKRNPIMNVKSIHHQYSLREALLEKLKYLEKQLPIDWVKVITLSFK